MDVAGVALATVISQIISSVLIVMSLRKQEGMCRLYIRKLRINKDILIRIIQIGLPASIQSMLFSISNIMIQSSVNSFDLVYAELGKAPYTSGAAAAGNIEGFIYTSVSSFQHAALNFTGQNYAAKKYMRERKILYTCLLAAVGVGITAGAAAIIFGRSLLGVYLPNDALAVDYGYQRMILLGATYFFCGIMEVLVGQLRGLGKSLVPMFISVLGICAFRVFWIYTIFAIDHDWLVLFISYPVSWILTSVLQFVCYYLIQKKIPKKDCSSSEPSKLNLSA